MVPRSINAGRPCLRLLASGQYASGLCIRQGESFSTTSLASSGKNAVALATGFPPEKFVASTTTPTAKPPSARPIDTRKSQLIRTYTSLLRTTPLILFFQHSNLTAVEWAAVRRELKKAVEAVSHTAEVDGPDSYRLSSKMQLQVVRTNMLDVAMRIVEFHTLGESANPLSVEPPGQGTLAHDLSEIAYKAIRETSIPLDSAYSQLQPLMVGPLAALVLPEVSPSHLAAALSILAPVPGVIPAPTRKKSPGYHDLVCQNGLAKLLLIGGRIEGKVFDQSGVNWIGGIRGGLEDLRAQLVGLLNGAGLGMTTTLGGGGRNLLLALEGRKAQLDDNDKHPLL